MGDDHPALAELKERLRREEEAYAALLAAVDRLATFPLPAEQLPDLPRRLEQLNAAWDKVPAPQGSGPRSTYARTVWHALAPALDRQRDFNSFAVQVLNGYLDASGRLHGHLRDLLAALVRLLQQVMPLVDARDRAASAAATTRAEVILEAFDRRQESLHRRVDALGALRDRVAVLGEEVAALARRLEGPAPVTAPGPSWDTVAEEAAYTAFENRYRGSTEEIKERLRDHVALFAAGGPVLDLGCGRGEFLELLQEAGLEGRGVEANGHVARACRERGLDVAEGDLLACLRATPESSLGGVFAAQVAEHLPPRVLHAVLREAWRALRPGGTLALETVNPRSVVGFLEVYNRDLTHERPLHPETLSFAAAAAGFTDVRVDFRSPVDPSARLQPVPVEGLPPRAAEALNENVARLNALVYGPQEYVLVARR